MYFQENIETFAKACVEAAKEHPDSIDDLTFSVIPALFGNIWCNEMAQLFVRFLDKVRAIDGKLAARFARIIFVLPEFRLFMEKVMDDMPITAVSVTQDDRAVKTFLDEFVKLWKEHIEYSPRILRDAMKNIKDAKDFFNIAFVEPMIISPLSYGVMKGTETWQNGVADKISTHFQVLIPKLVDAMKKVDKPAALMLSADILEIAPNIHRCVLLCETDLRLISLLSRYASKYHSSVEAVDFNSQLSSEKYIVYVYRQNLEVKRPVVPKLTAVDDLESELRMLLTEAHIIPLAACSMEDPDIVEVLRSQVNLSREDQRLHLQVQIDKFKSAHERSQKQWSFDELVDLLKKKFDERKENRLSDLRKISFWTLCIQSLGTQMQKFLGESLWPMTFDVQKYFCRQWFAHKKINTVKVDQYTSEFIKLAQEWGEYCQTRHIDFKLDFIVIGNAIASSMMSIEKFIAQNPKLVEYDAWAYKTAKQTKPSVLDEWAHQPKEWQKAMSRESLTKPLVRAVNRVLNSKSAAMKLLYWSDLPRAISKTLQTECGVDNPGADELTPCTFLILVAAEPKNVISSLCYLLSGIGEPYGERHAMPVISSEYTEARSFEYQRASISAILMDYRKQYKSMTGENMELPKATVAVMDRESVMSD